jgi:hypothetical protein
VLCPHTQPGPVSAAPLCAIPGRGRWSEVMCGGRMYSTRGAAQRDRASIASRRVRAYLLRGCVSVRRVMCYALAMAHASCGALVPLYIFFSDRGGCYAVSCVCAAACMCADVCSIIIYIIVYILYLYITV